MREDASRRKSTRRGVLQSSASLGAVSLVGGVAASAVAKTADDAAASPAAAGGKGAKVRPNPIAISTYSFWRFKDDSKVPIEDCTHHSAAMGFDAVEILRMQMDREDNA